MNNKIIEIDNAKYIKRYLYGREILENFEFQNKFVKHYINNDIPWSTLTSDGEAFIGDTIKFIDGYEATIVSVLKNDFVNLSNLTSYNVILQDIYIKTKKYKIPLNARASWECTITRLYKK